MTTPRLTACLITRDEAPRLPRCLGSLAGVVDELIVVDTGSTDDTVAIAARAGAVVRRFAWVDDFSAARNEALAAATGDWILSIDADEWLHPEAGEALRRAARRPEVLAYRVTQRNYLDDGRWDDAHVTRFFRRDPRVRFEGRVHEQVTTSVARCLGPGVLAADLFEAILEHDGYLEQALRERQKGPRNIALLERSLLDAPDDLFLRYKLASELGAAGGAHLDLVLAGLRACPAAALPGMPWAEEALLNGALRRSDAGPLDEVEPLAARCAAAFGDHPALALARARVALAQGRPEDALRRLAGAVPTGRGPSFDPAALRLEGGLVEAQALLALGRLEPCLERLAALRAEFPRERRPAHALIRLAIQLRDFQSGLELGLARLREDPGDAETLALCADAIEALGDAETARTWRRQLGGR